MAELSTVTDSGPASSSIVLRDCPYAPRSRIHSPLHRRLDYQEPPPDHAAHGIAARLVARYTHALIDDDALFTDHRRRDVCFHAFVAEAATQEPAYRAWFQAVLRRAEARHWLHGRPADAHVVTGGAR
jgi:hypothetical protein